LVLGPPCGDYKSAVCPTASPQKGDPCPAFGLVCEFGDAAALHDCNASAYCAADCTWYPSAAPAPQGVCAPSQDCPPSYSAAAHGGSCLLQNGNAWSCDYPEGQCRCDGAVDGGAAWSCDPVPAGCPVPRPFIGAPCTQEGLECYWLFGCANPTTGMLCVQGHWAAAPQRQCG
jgi:hypothetical protein